MTLGEFRVATQSLNGDLDLVTVGHYGEIDQEVDSVQVANLSPFFSSGKNKRDVLVLEGISPSYEEPD